MSDLYNAFFKDYDPKRYDKRDANGDPTPFDLAKLEVGLTFEEMLEKALAESILGERPGEFTTDDGVIYSPDYLFYETDEIILGEFKCTWYSSRNAPFDPKFEKWLCQIQCYLYHLNMRKARLYVLFLNGDYKPPSPQLLAWEMTFTTRELADNWRVVKDHAVRKGLLT